MPARLVEDLRTLALSEAGALQLEKGITDGGKLNLVSNAIRHTPPRHDHLVHAPERLKAAREP